MAVMQLVKGTREPGESPLAGASRELTGEACIVAGAGANPQWASAAIAERQVWHFVPVTTQGVPDRFDFLTADVGGHLSQFGWWRLGDDPGPYWHYTFVRALHEIRDSHD